MTDNEKTAIAIIDAVEDFLKARDVRIPTSDREMKEQDALEGNDAVIYGNDFGELQAAIADILEEVAK